MIYSFFDVGPDARKGLGTYIILDHIIRAARAGLPYVYLGYWVEGSPRMAYKTSFRPLERLGRDGWRRIDEIGPEAQIELNLPARPERKRHPDRRLALASVFDPKRTLALLLASAEKRGCMHFHLPKPLHGWRAVWGEWPPLLLAC